MASYTGNLGLKKPALDDDALITDINHNMEIVDAAINGIQDGLAIVANNNTHVAITAGQFVYVRNHSTLTEGLYVASTNIAANATLSSSNLTADAAGGLNSLNDNLANKIKYIDTTVTGAINTLDNGVYILETSMPSGLPAGSVVITVEVKSATIFASVNATTNKLYLYCMVQKASATHNIRVYYYMP